MSDGTQCRLRGRAEAVHVKLVDGLRADGLEVHTLSSAQSHLSRAERSIVDHILCEEAELFLRPCAACHDQGRTGYYQAWTLKRRALLGRPSIDISFGGSSNASRARTALYVPMFHGRHSRMLGRHDQLNRLTRLSQSHGRLRTK